MSEEARIRRDQAALVYGGIGVIVFGLWGFAKVVIQIVIDPMGIKKHIGSTENAELLFAVVAVLLVLIILADALIRLWLGLSAIREGKGRRRSMAYVVIAAIYLMYNMGTDIYTVFNLLEDGSVSAESVAALIISATSSFALWEIINASLSLRRLMKRT